MIQKGKYAKLVMVSEKNNNKIEEDVA